MAGRSPAKLGAKWQLDAALLSRPVDLSALVSLSLTDPKALFADDTLHRMVKVLLNEQDGKKSTHDTKLEVLTILGNLAKHDTLSAVPQARDEVKMVLQGVSEWFDEYLQSEPIGGCDRDGAPLEPEIHKHMLLVLCRCYSYALTTADLLDLCGGNRATALVTVVALLEEGETYTPLVSQTRRPGAGHAQWERRLVAERYEKALVLQLCRLLRGFTHPSAYFESRAIAPGGALGHAEGDDDGLSLHSVDEFGEAMDSLLSLAVSSKLLEKLTVALHFSLFFGSGDDNDIVVDNGDPGVDMAQGVRVTNPKLLPRRLLEGDEHLAVASVLSFVENLFTYSSGAAGQHWQRHLLAGTSLVGRLVLPYLELCVLEARLRTDAAQEKLRVPTDSQGGRREGDRAQAAQAQAQAQAHTPPYTPPRTPPRTPRTDDASAAASARDPRDDGPRARSTAALASGVSAALRTLILATFRADCTDGGCGDDDDGLAVFLGVLRTLNPTASLLRAGRFVETYPTKVLAMLCLLNVNLNTVDVATKGWGSKAAACKQREGRSDDDDEEEEEEVDGAELVRSFHAHSLLHDVALAQAKLPPAAQSRVLEVVLGGRHGLPVARDVPSYNAIVGVLTGTAADAAFSSDAAGRQPDTPLGQRSGAHEASPHAYLATLMSGAAAVNEGGGLVTNPGETPGNSPAHSHARDQGDGFGTIWTAGRSDGSDEDEEIGRAAAKAAAKDRAARLAAQAKHSPGQGSGGIGGSGERGASASGAAFSECAAEAKGSPRVEGSGGTAGAKGEGAGAKGSGDDEAKPSVASPAASSAVALDRFRLLGDLPPVSDGRAGLSKGVLVVGGAAERAEARRALANRLAGQAQAGQARAKSPDRSQGGRSPNKAGKEAGNNKAKTGGAGGDGAPASFRCAINGHVMKEPVMSPHGHTFEAATIRLWLASNGQVCPLTGRPLSLRDLREDRQLRSELLRWQITNRQDPRGDMPMGGGGDDDDDALYDF